ALGTERLARHERRAAVAAELLGGRRRGRERAAAVLAELAAAGLAAAVRALRGALVPVVDVAGPVDLLGLLVELVDLGGRLDAGDLLVELWRALRAQAALGVPAHLLAHPLAAAQALLEVGGHLLDGLAQPLVPGRAAVAVAHPLRVPAELRRLRADLAAEQVA